MAPKPSQDTLIHCESCGEEYSSTYRSCPFCGARNAPARRNSGRDDPKSSSRYIPTPPPARDRRSKDEGIDDTYVFDGQDAFDDEPEEDYYTPRSKGGKRLAPKEGGFELPPINWPRLITFLCSLIIIVAALIIVFTSIYPKLHDKDKDKDKDKDTNPSGAVSMEPSAAPTPIYTDPVIPSDDPVIPSDPVDPVDTPPVATTPVGSGTPATVVNASSGLRVRSGPGTSYEVVASLVNGSRINVIAPSDNGWYSISFAGSNGAVINGYIMGEYISTIGSSGSTNTNPPAISTPAPSTGGNPTVGRPGTIVGADGGLRVRSGPSTSHEVVASLVNGNAINVVADAGGGWYQITFAGSGGSTINGYIMGQYISTN